MKKKHLYQAMGEAAVLADELLARLPECCRASLPREVAFEVAWPLAVRLTRLKRQAAKDQKAAALYRQARADAAAVLQGRPDTAAALPDLLRTVPFSVDHWQVRLVPRVAVTEFEAA